jgi:hypothetical protein
MLIRYFGKKNLWYYGIIGILVIGIVLIGLGLGFAKDVALQASADKIALPIIMYHGVAKDNVIKNNCVVSGNLLEKDLSYLRDNGYRAVFLSELIDYVNNGRPLPKKPILITFDDGYINTIGYVLPLLEKYQTKALVIDVFSQPSSLSEAYNRDSTYLGYHDIKVITQSGYMEIGNHDYGESEYIESKIKDREGIKAPRVSLSADEKINYISRDPQSLQLLGCFNRPYNISTEEFMKHIP